MSFMGRTAFGQQMSPKLGGTKKPVKPSGNGAAKGKKTANAKKR